MFKNSFQLYEIGKELGLNKKEIKSQSPFVKYKHPFLYAVLLVLSIFVIAIIIYIGICIERSTYAAGSYYSTVKRKDFRRNKRFKLR